MNGAESAPYHISYRPGSAYLSRIVPDGVEPFGRTVCPVMRRPDGTPARLEGDDLEGARARIEDVLTHKLDHHGDCLNGHPVSAGQIAALAALFGVTL